MPSTGVLPTDSEVPTPVPAGRSPPRGATRGLAADGSRSATCGQSVGGLGSGSRKARPLTVAFYTWKVGHHMGFAAHGREDIIDHVLGFEMIGFDGW